MPVLNKLQHVLGIVGKSSIPLPQLVVVGSQSSGKSSVLENIVGRDFLPRGNNMVTKRPLVLQLMNWAHSEEAKASRSRRGDSEQKGGPASLSSTTVKEYGVFGHKSAKFYDFSAIKAEIAEETKRLTGRNNSVSSEPIFLTIYSPHFINLTLVDLPGITKNATEGQPLDIEQQIRQMVYKFVSNPHSLIVAVSAANEDLANSEALKISRDVDPEGLRTIGVLTKLDLMDKGTNALPIIQNQVIPLRLGYVGIVSRCQQDIIENKKSIREALHEEAAFFRQHNAYSAIADAMGTPFLVKRLNALLLSHLQTYLPSLKQEVVKNLQFTERELETYGSPLAVDGITFSELATYSPDEYMGASAGAMSTTALFANMLNGPNRAKVLGPMLLDLLSRYAAYFNDLLDGKSSLNEASSQHLFGGARINFVFHDLFCSHIDSIDPLASLSDADIRAALRNSTGPRPTLFLPEGSFEMLVKRQVHY